MRRSMLLLFLSLGLAACVSSSGPSTPRAANDYRASWVESLLLRRVRSTLPLSRPSPSYLQTGVDAPLRDRTS